MKRKDRYFTIERTHLKEKKIFPFHLYVYHPVHKTYTLYLPANHPLNGEKDQLLSFITSKGGKIAINFRQRQTFLRCFNYYDLDIPSLVPEDLKQVERERLEHLKEVESKKGVYHHKEVMLKAIAQDNFLPMIEAARNQIMAFSVRISHTTSLARYFAQFFMHEDTHLNRVVALSFFTAKQLDISEEQELGELVCASFLAHIGQSQYSPIVSQRPHVQLKEKERWRFEKHPGLSLHLLKKSRVELSDRCLKIIEQHHERTQGQGFPQQKRSPHIDFLALILGACAHIFEFSQGKVTGKEVPLTLVVQNLKDKNFNSGLEFRFDDTILDSLIHNMQTHSLNEAA